MRWTARILCRIALLAVTAAGSLAPLSAALYTSEDLELYGDVRLRLEQDWDSSRADGSERDDRARMRTRFRLGLNFESSERVAFGVRLRSGSDLSQQSSHITILDFDDNDTGDADFNFDRWFVRARSGEGRVSGWAGRNNLPFWKQNEIFWDDDVTPAGIGGTFKSKSDRGVLSVNAGYFALPVGMKNFSGEMGGLQLVYSGPVRGAAFTVAGGYFSVRANPSDTDAGLLLNGDGLRDYEILVGNVQVTLDGNGRPWVFGADYIENLEDYSANDPQPFTATHADQTGGHVLSLRYGDTSERGNWLAAWYYARIEALAVIGSYAQDDWMRWGSSSQTKSSNYKGHELRLAYAASANLNVVARLYLVESITTVEDGRRFRVDFNYKLNRRSK